MEEKKSNDRPFYVSIESVVLFNNQLNSTDKIVYGVISAFSMNKDGYCYLRYKQIAQYAQITKRNLYKCIKKLVNMQYLTKVLKNDRVYLMPTTNAFIKMREEKKFNENGFHYDWLNDDSED